MTTDREPTVKVGIMSAAELNIDLLMPYTETGSETEARGRQTLPLLPTAASNGGDWSSTT